MNSPASVYPYLLLVVEPKSHFVLGVAMLGTENQTYDALITSIPDELLRICDKQAVRPASIAVASQSTYSLLVTTAGTLHIPCDLKKRLPALDDALASLWNFMEGRN